MKRKKVCAYIFCTFLGGGGAFGDIDWLLDSASWCPFSENIDRLESSSESTTKKWWHFSHFTNLVEAKNKIES